MACSMAKVWTVEDLMAEGSTAERSVAEDLVTVDLAAVNLRAQRSAEQDLVAAEEEPGQVRP